MMPTSEPACVTKTPRLVLIGGHHGHGHHVSMIGDGSFSACHGLFGPYYAGFNVGDRYFLACQGLCLPYCTGFSVWDRSFGTHQGLGFGRNYKRSEQLIYKTAEHKGLLSRVSEAGDPRRSTLQKERKIT